MRRRFKSARRKRSVAWIPGITTFDTGVAATNSRLVALAALSAAVPNTWGVALAVTDDTDLSMHGGEDAVLTRIRGRLFFSDGRVNSGAGLAASAFQLRVAVTQTDITPALAVTPFDFTTSAGLGNDNILWMDSVLVPSVVTTGAGTNIDTVDWEHFQLDIDVRAKRKLQSDRQVVLWFQSVFNGGTVTAVDFRLRGGLRSLLMRSR